MWEIDNLLQVINFARSLCLGVAFCLVYDILRAIRKLFDFSAISIFFKDIAFSLFSAFITFIFLLSVTNGELRGFVFISISLGFFLSRFTFSKIWIWLLKKIIGFIKSGFCVVSKAFYGCFDFLEENIVKFSQKCFKELKKLLKNLRKLLYTKQDRKV